MKIVAVTACPQGVAHTYLSAEALEKAAKKRGVKIKVETQGAIGAENVITQEEADAADVVILTDDVRIRNEERFRNKPVEHTTVSKLIRGSAEMIDTLIKKYAE